MSKRTYLRHEVAEMLNVLPWQISFATTQTGFMEARGHHGQGKRYLYTDRDIAKIKRYFDAKQEWHDAIEDLGVK